MVDFDYLRPRTVADACNLLVGNPEARALAGGQTLIPSLKQRLVRPALLVDLQDIEELRGIRIDDQSVTVGAMTCHQETAENAGIRAAIPALSHLAGGIAHPQVRHLGTMGGSIANNDPAADYPAALVGLGAEVQTSRRRIPADAFFTGLFSTALEPDELVVSIRFPRPRRAGYWKFANPASGYVTTGCFVAETDAGIRVAVNGAAPSVFRQQSFEQALTERFAPESLLPCHQEPRGLNSDMHASAEYRARLVALAARRALAMALAGG